MTRKEGDTDLLPMERELLLSLTADYMMFGLRDIQIIDQLERRIKRRIAPRTLFYIKREINQRRASGEVWLDEFARGKMADFYRTRIEELEYIQKNLLILFHTEADKTEHQNKYLMNQLAKTIVENSKTLAEFGLAPPIIATIKQMLPVDINELNSRVEKSKEAARKYISLDDPTNTILDKNGQDQPQQQDISDIEHIRRENRQAKTAFILDTDDDRDPGTSEADSEPRDKDPNRVF